MATVIHCFIMHNSCVDTYTQRRGSLMLLYFYRFSVKYFDANGYHPFKGWYPCELNRHIMEI